jgi:hypothetical protein
MQQPNDDFFFDPELDEAEGPETPPSFARNGAEPHLAKQRDYLERLLQAWQQAHGHKKKQKAA